MAVFNVLHGDCTAGKLEIGIFLEDGSTKFVTIHAGEGVIIPEGEYLAVSSEY